MKPTNDRKRKQKGIFFGLERRSFEKILIEGKKESKMNLMSVTSMAVRIWVITLFLLQNVSLPVLMASDFTTAPSASPQIPGMTLEQATNLQAQQPAVPNTAAQNASLGTSLQNTQSMLAESPLTLVTDQNAPMEISTVTGHVYNVSKTGSNNADGSETAPWASVKYAVSKLQAGDTLYIHEGVYAESASFLNSGRADASISVIGIGNVVFDGTGMRVYGSAFDTKGNDYLKLQNISARNMRAVIEVSAGSDFIDIDGIQSDKNRFAVLVTGSANVAVRNAVVRDSKNGFRAVTSRNLVYENIDVSGSKDIYDGMNEDYHNGDGFIFEADVSNVTMRNIITHDNWDGGIDCKASNVLIENVISYGNKNNFKMWGQNITIRNSLGYNAVPQLRSNGTTVEGNDLTVEVGGTVTLDHVTLSSGGDHNIAIYANGTLRLRNSIVQRVRTPGSSLLSNAGVLISDNVLWYEKGAAQPASLLSPTDLWADPQFVDAAAFNFQLKSTSPAIDRASPGNAAGSNDLNHQARVAGNAADLGAYEFQGNQPAPNPGPLPVSSSVVVQATVPTPPPASESLGGEFLGLQEGQTVSGDIFFQPNLDMLKGVKQVSYYIDGKVKMKETKPPFIMDDASGYDTTRMKDGRYEFKAVYLLTDGSTHEFIANIQIANDVHPAIQPTPLAAAPDPLPSATSALIGLTAGQTVEGIIFVQPNPNLVPDLTNVSYFLNGKKSGKTKDFPFVWGGSDGFDTRKLADGTYILQGICETPAGPQTFSIMFQVTNKH